MTADQFRKIALAFPDVVEAEHQRHPDFRRNGKIFATLGYPDDNYGMVKLTAEQQVAFMATHGEVLTACNGAWGRAGCTNVLLAKANAKLARDVMTHAIENVGATPQTKSPRRSRREDSR